MLEPSQRSTKPVLGRVYPQRQVSQDDDRIVCTCSQAIQVDCRALVQPVWRSNDISIHEQIQDEVKPVVPDLSSNISKHDLSGPQAQIDASENSMVTRTHEPQEPAENIQGSTISKVEHFQKTTYTSQRRFEMQKQHYPEYSGDSGIGATILTATSSHDFTKRSRPPIPIDFRLLSDTNLFQGGSDQRSVSYKDPADESDYANPREPYGSVRSRFPHNDGRSRTTVVAGTASTANRIRLDLRAKLASQESTIIYLEEELREVRAQLLRSEAAVEEAHLDARILRGSFRPLSRRISRLENATNVYGGQIALSDR